MELTRQQHEERTGSFSIEPLMGGFIATLAGMYMAGLLDQVAGHCGMQWINVVDSMARRLSCSPSIYVYMDSEDTEAQFSVKAGSLVPDGLWIEYAGNTAQGDLLRSQNNHIWLDVSAAPTVTLAFGSAWPSVAHIRIATIAMPASGPWREQDVTRLVGAQTLQAIGGGAGKKKTTLTSASGAEVALSTLPAGTVAGNCVVLVKTAFDGTAPTLTLGDDGDNDRLVEATDVDLTTTGTYAVPKMEAFSAQTAIKAFLNADSSTVGEAIILWEQV